MWYYTLFVGATVITQINSVYLYKKYQMAAGTGWWSNVIYMVINGIVSALMPLSYFVFSDATLQLTPYSFVFALATVICAAVGFIFMLKAYEIGQIAIVNILITIGGIVIPCLWGVLFLHEELSLQSILAIGIMLLAVFFALERQGEKLNKKMIWMYLIIIGSNCTVTLLGKQHQIEVYYDTVDTMSYSVWIGTIRALLFLGIGAFLLLFKKQSIEEIPISKAVAYAGVSSVASSGSYMLILVTATVLPVVITSPLGTGIGMVMSSFLPWLIYHEVLTKKQWIGVGLSCVGVLLFLI